MCGEYLNEGHVVLRAERLHQLLVRRLRAVLREEAHFGLLGVQGLAKKNTTRTYFSS